MHFIMLIVRHFVIFCGRLYFVIFRGSLFVTGTLKKNVFENLKIYKIFRKNKKSEEPNEITD